VTELPTRAQWQAGFRLYDSDVATDAPAPREAAPNGVHVARPSRGALMAVVTATAVAAIVVLLIFVVRGSVDAGEMEDRVYESYASTGPTDVACRSDGRDEFLCDVTVRYAASDPAPGAVKCDGSLLARPDGSDYSVVQIYDGLDLCF
jgi:hypothetical protein